MFEYILTAIVAIIICVVIYSVTCGKNNRLK